MRRCRLARAVIIGLLLGATASGCGWGAAAPGPGEPPPAAAWFVDATEASGLDFVQFNGMTGRWYDAENLGGGVALLDYDNDGDLDAFLVQGGILNPDDRPGDFVFPPAGPAGGRLFRNDLVPGGVMTFTDVTVESGIEALGYGMGVATGDYDNDGWVDLYVTNLGPNQLLRNNGDGTFTDVTTSSGVGGDGWSVSASFVDVERDGWLDLYVGNYLAYDVARDLDCVGPTGGPDYCAPANYRPQPDRLYRNAGDGTFVDVTATAFPGGDFGPALGVIAFDADSDGWPDIYVANDAAENLLWMNQGDGTFTNQALLAGVAVNAAGQPEASMGVDVGDADNDGDDDLFMTHQVGEKHTLYVQTGAGVFEDRSASAGLVGPSLRRTGWGTAWIDVDADGWLDLLVVNGGVIAGERGSSGALYPFDEPNQLFRNLGDGRFEDASTRGGAALERSEVSRGAAFGDVDNDGDVDVLVGNNAGPARLLLNEAPGGSWIGLRLVAGVPARDVTGARVIVERPDGTALRRRAHTDGSYASASDPRVLVGLGPTEGPVRVRVQWLDGSEETWPALAIDAWHTLEMGEAP